MYNLPKLIINLSILLLYLLKFIIISFIHFLYILLKVGLKVVGFIINQFHLKTIQLHYNLPKLIINLSILLLYLLKFMIISFINFLYILFNVGLKEVFGVIIIIIQLLLNLNFVKILFFIFNF